MEIDDTSFFLAVFGAIVVVVECMGLVSAGHAIMAARTAQGAIAWAICLISFPAIALPAY